MTKEPRGAAGLCRLHFVFRSARFLIHGALALFGALSLEAQDLVPGDVFVSEFMAAGSSTFDEDGDASDWLEIYNALGSPVDLGGLYLTDDASDLTRWELPSRVIAPNAHLLVFASGKDRAGESGELHTNFRLDRDGEYLALVAPDGVTILDEYAPRYPEQRAGFSYGVRDGASSLVNPQAPIEAFVPLDDSLGLSWTEPDFVPGPEWIRGPGGAGYVQSAGEPTEGLVAYYPFDGDVEDAAGPNDGTFRGGNAFFVTDRDGRPTRALRFDGIDDYVELDQRSGLPIYGHPAFSVSLWVRGGPQPDRRVFAEGASSSNDPVFTLGTQNTGVTGQFDIYIRDASGTPVEEHNWSSMEAFDGQWHHVAYVDEGGDAALYIDGVRDATDYRYAKRPIPFDRSSIGAILRAESSYPFQGDLDDVSLWSRALSPDEVATLARGEAPTSIGDSALRAAIGTDLEGAMAGVSPSAYIRIPFESPVHEGWDTLRLRISYDDGFVAYLNGVEIARRNAPPVVSWSSSSTTERERGDALEPETISIPAPAGLLLDGLNILAIHGLNSRIDDDEFLIRAELFASRQDGNERRFLATPTPGAPNDSAIAEFVEDTRFSIDRGLFAAPFDVEITCGTPNAEIRYTVDGRSPTATNGFAYSGPLRIETTTVLRAAAFLEGFEPSNVDTQTYLFPEDVLGQTQPPSYPRAWAGYAADYDMDPEIVSDPEYGPSMLASLRALPVISIALDEEGLFGPSGIYDHPQSRGRAWERAASAELIRFDGERGFQVDAGLRIVGNRSRDPAASPKHGFRFLFRGEYGAEKLRYPLFRDSPLDRFDTIILRPNAFDSWVSNDASQRQGAQYIRDQWVRDAQRDTGQPAAHGFYVHVYLNGLYWGVYNLAERPDASFAAEYLGGDKEDYDVVKNHEELLDGSINAYRELDRLRATDLSRNENYAAMLEYLDAENFADYMIVNMFAPATDWPGNYYMVRERRPGAGFKFFCWDTEYAFLGGVGNNRTLPHSRDADSPTKFYHALRANPEFRVLFGDHIHRHFFSGGALTPAEVEKRWLANTNAIELALLAESARWGDHRRATPYTPDHEWRAESDRLLATYFPRRTAIVLDQFRAQGMYPEIEAPRFAAEDGSTGTIDVEPGFEVEISAPDGLIYYTIDGSDPRLEGGEPSPTVSILGAGARQILLSAGAPARALIPEDDSLGTLWITPEFDDTGWTGGTTGVGFERTTGYEQLIGLDLADSMDGKNASAYIRVPFEIPSLADLGEIDRMTLSMKYDDGFVAYLNGEEIARRNAPESLAWTSQATNPQSDADAVVFEDVDASASRALLREGRNMLAIHGLNSSSTSGDFLIVPELEVSSSASEPGIVIEETTLVRARARDRADWSALSEATFAVDTGLRITEIHYHPAGPIGESPFAADELEFIELQNVSARSLELDGLRFTEGIEFDFGASVVEELAPGEVLVLVENLDAFATLHELDEMRIGGEYQGRLANDGETLRVSGRFGETVLEVTYDDEWYPETDGDGYSLVTVDPRGPRDRFREREDWRASEILFGTPGVVEEAEPRRGLQIPSDFNQDARVDLSDAVVLLRYLFLGSPANLPCDGDLGSTANRALLDANGDAQVGLSDAIRVLGFLFQGALPPVLGMDCVEIPGCPIACGN